jgi:hypothetical protein
MTPRKQCQVLCHIQMVPDCYEPDLAVRSRNNVLYLVRSYHSTCIAYL